jgi:hypothetical protein
MKSQCIAMVAARSPQGFSKSTAEGIAPLLKREENERC